MSNPSARQSACTCRRRSCSLSLSVSRPISIRSTCSANGSFSSGRLNGSAFGSGSDGAKLSSISPVTSSSMHRVRLSRHAGDQARRGCCTSTRSSPCVQTRRSACQRCPSRPSNASTLSPGTCANSQRLPLVVPSSVPRPIITSSSKASSVKPTPHNSRLTVPAPLRSAAARRPRYPAGGPGRRESARPARPSARRHRLRSSASGSPAN